jgi:hypothetical protein
MHYLDYTHQRSAALQRAQSAFTRREFSHELVEMGWLEPFAHPTQPDLYRIIDVGLEEVHH